jgi:hypothetical protein
MLPLTSLSSTEIATDPIMCAGNRPLSRVGPFIIARRYTYTAISRRGLWALITWDPARQPTISISR